MGSTRLITTVCFAFCAFILPSTKGKVYERCELARELKVDHEIPFHQIATWVCIARYESEYNTSAVNHGSGDHGLFQISDLYWCSPPGQGYACNRPCSAFEDDDIEDDVVCARRIFREHKRITGDGFNAWVVYNQHCKHDVNKFIEGCFEEDHENDVVSTTLKPNANPKDNSIARTIKPFQRLTSLRPPTPLLGIRPLANRRSTVRPRPFTLLPPRTTTAAPTVPPKPNLATNTPVPFSLKPFAFAVSTSNPGTANSVTSNRVQKFLGLGKTAYTFSRKGNGFSLRAD